MMKADDQECTGSPATPLHVAVERGHVEIVRFLLASGADVQAETSMSFSPLHLACSLGHVDVAQTLIEAGAETSKAAEQGITPLLIAVQHGHADVVATLLKAGVAVSVAAANGIAPIHLAAAEGKLEILQDLCAAPDLEVNQVTDTDFSALDFAARCGSLECCTLLCSYGASMRDDAVEQAKECGHDDVAEWLTQTSAFSTPLHYPLAVTPQRARELLRSGADVHALGHDGIPVTPYSIARGMCDRGEALPGSTAELVVDAAAPWSIETHDLFPLESRTHAVDLFRAGLLLSSSLEATVGQERAFVDVWVEHVLPYAVTR